jgi:hypothetical protein
VNDFTGAVLLAKWIVAAFVSGATILRVVGALIEREVEVWQGIVAISAAVVLTIMAISLAMTGWYLPILVCIVFLAVAVHTITIVDERLRAHRMQMEDIERYQKTIEFDEKNAAAHAYLARIYRKQGRFQEALAQYERAAALDPNDAEARRELKALIVQMQALEAAPACPQCESPLDPSGKTCPECGWSRSTIKGLRDVYASGGVKQGLIWGIVVSTAVGIVLTLLRISIQFTLTLLIIGWIIGFLFIMRWILRVDL